MTAFNDFLIKKFAPELVGAEIGVRDGAHAIQMMGAHKMKMMYLVDPFLPYDDVGVRMYTKKDQEGEYQKLLKIIRDHKEYRKKIKFLKETSEEARIILKHVKFDFIYIDADHHYKNVKDDLRWWDLVKPGGVMGGHDYTEAHGCKGVIQAVDEFVKEKRLKSKLFTKGSRGTVEWAIIKPKK